MIKNGMRPVHPGEVLFEEFMKPSNPPINATIRAKALEVPANRMTAIIKGPTRHYRRYCGTSGDVVQPYR